MITIEKAIETLTDMAYLRKPVEMQDYTDASKLGIEALKFKKAIRAHTVDDFDALLPGETED